MKVPHYSVPPAALQLLRSTEGKVLAVGVASVVLMLLAFGIGWLVAPQAATLLAAMSGLNLLIGPVAGMSFGFANGMDHISVIVDAIVIESMQVLIVFPLFVLSWNHLLDLPRLRPLLARMQVRAESQRVWVRRLGIAGLFLFVLVPFWMTGPIIGAIIGFLIGLRTAFNLAIVLTANSVAIVGWALSLYEISRVTAGISRYAVLIAVLAVTLLALSWRLLSRRTSRGGAPLMPARRPSEPPRQAVARTAQPAAHR